MGEAPETILAIGCPSSDIARKLDRRLLPEAVNSNGSGAIIDVTKSFLLVLFHPTTTEYGGERQQMEEVLEALYLFADADYTSVAEHRRWGRPY